MYAEYKISNYTYHLYGTEGGRSKFPYFDTCYKNARKNGEIIFELFEYIYHIMKIREFPWYTEYCVIRYRTSDCRKEGGKCIIPPKVAASSGCEIAIIWEGK